MKNRPADQRYWDVVRDCLIEFHALTARQARARIASFRADLESALDKRALNLFYHTDPFDVACDITGTRLRGERYVERYQRLLDSVNEGARRRSSKTA
jgi:hypothetical protein